jgi:hypothetical protein
MDVLSYREIYSEFMNSTDGAGLDSLNPSQTQASSIDLKRRSNTTSVPNP